MTLFTTEFQDWKVVASVGTSVAFIGANQSVAIFNATAVTSVSAYPATHKVKFQAADGSILYLLATSVNG